MINTEDNTAKDNNDIKYELPDSDSNNLTKQSLPKSDSYSSEENTKITKEQINNKINEIQNKNKSIQQLIIENYWDKKKLPKPFIIFPYKNKSWINKYNDKNIDFGDFLASSYNILNDLKKYFNKIINSKHNNDDYQTLINDLQNIEYDTLTNKIHKYFKKPKVNYNKITEIENKFFEQQQSIKEENKKSIYSLLMECENDNNQLIDLINGYLTQTQPTGGKKRKSLKVLRSLSSERNKIKQTLKKNKTRSKKLTKTKLRSKSK